MGAEQTLRNREAQLHEAMALASLGTWEWDLQQDTITWSPELRKILGVRDEVAASAAAFMALVHPEDRAWADKAMRESLVTGVAHEVPFRIVRPDGAVRIVKGRATTTRFEDGKPVHMVGAIQDLGSSSNFPDLSGVRSTLDSMSEREKQVLVLVAQGRTSKEIGAALELSPKTVDTYRSRVMAKLGVEDLAGLVRFSIRHGIVTL